MTCGSRQRCDLTPSCYGKATRFLEFQAQRLLASAPAPAHAADSHRLIRMTVISFVGYTATAAANLLQNPANPLYPSHFAYLLRYAGETDTILRFAESNSDAWYTGGECYYEAFGEEAGEANNFLVSASIEDSHLAL